MKALFTTERLQARASALREGEERKLRYMGKEIEAFGLPIA